MSSNRVKTINYLWVGPPTKFNPNAIAGHDVAGPFALAKAMRSQKAKNECTQNPIKFWCLKEYKRFYQEQFEQGGANDIEVCAIEDFIQSKKESANQALRQRAQLVDKFLSQHPLVDVSTCVRFKDFFSLFLLASQGGYFFDTNVFPVQGKVIILPGEEQVMTARSPDQTNDFYLMYSPQAVDGSMLKIFDRWLECKSVDTFGNYSERPPYFDKAKMACVKKMSYKSYHSHGVTGLFFWFNTDLATFETYLHYGDINFAQPYPKSIKALEQCSLCTYSSDNDDVDLLQKNWKALPFKTDKAYISIYYSHIFFVDRNTNTCVDVIEGGFTIHDYLPEPIHHRSKPKKIVQPEPGLVEKIITYSQKPYFPSHIVNIDNCTLLHHAVLQAHDGNDTAIEKVRLLLRYGARLDVQAAYHYKEVGKNPIRLDMTPLELAAYLKHTKVVSLLQEHLFQTEGLNQASKQESKQVLPYVGNPSQDCNPSPEGDGPGDLVTEITPLIEKQSAKDQKSFWQKHWKKILIGAAIGALLVISGVLTGGLVPIIAAGLGVSFAAASVIGFGGAAVVGAALGAGYVAATIPSKEEPGEKSFLSRHKGKIIIAGIAALIIVGSILTGGLVGALGLAAGAGFLTTMATGIGAGLASSLGISAGVATTITGAAIVTVGAATITTSTGTMIGVLVDKQAKNSVNRTQGDEIAVPPPDTLLSQPPKRNFFSNLFSRFPSLPCRSKKNEHEAPRP